MAHVLLINTGGTIAMSEDHTTRKVSPTRENPIRQQGNFINHFATVTFVDLFNLPSPHMTQAQMLELSNYIRDHAGDYDGIVVTHGTDTLEETAYFLQLNLNLSQAVVVTGAMRSSNEIGADGMANLRSAIMAAAAPQSRDQGVLVVMNEEIHTATYVTKTHTTNLATFQTPTFGPIGLISKNQVLYFQKILHRDYYPVKEIKKPVALLKAYAGMQADIITAIGASHYGGLVIEGLGAGNLPPATVPATEALLAQGIPVVMVSRAFNGVIEDVYDYEGGGKQLKQAGVIFAQGLSGVKARLKLECLLNAESQVDLGQAFAWS
ncbi:asparaginase [Eremococcus coleocola]|uniref:asparaginase n=1 Tax=Eremococcus coleocola TaxID=88132 RepID=UPI0004089F16|nr:asparaginase [Eremococcus coleocola]